MTGRSYLQRIAEPLLPGEPVLFAVPTATPDEARPAAVPQPPLAAAQGSQPVLRRTPARSTPAPAQSTASAAPPLPITPAASSTDASSPGTSVPSASTMSMDGTPVPIAAGQPAPLLSPPQAQGPEAAVPVALDGVGSPPTVRAAAIGAPEAAKSSVGFDPLPSLAQEAPVLPAAHAIPSAAPFAEPARAAAHREAAALPATSEVRPTPTPPRIHIGTVEVHAAAPPPAAVPPPASPRAAPRVEAAPISRGYAWRFGLVQG